MRVICVSLIRHIVTCACLQSNRTRRGQSLYSKQGGMQAAVAARLLNVGAIQDKEGTKSPDNLHFVANRQQKIDEDPAECGMC